MHKMEIKSNLTGKITFEIQDKYIKHPWNETLSKQQDKTLQSKWNKYVKYANNLSSNQEELNEAEPNFGIIRLNFPL